MKAKPIIGVLPLWDIDRSSLWMLSGYLEGIRLAGGTPIILTFDLEDSEVGRLVSLCDGLLFTGGQDVHPSVYGEEDSTGKLIPCPKRDILEVKVLKAALEADKAVFGICRGLQLINAALGGTLYQDLPTMHPSEISHRQERPYDKPSHEVTLVPGTPLMKLTGKNTLQVNSCHHQAIKDLASGLMTMAVSPDGLIEAVFAQSQRFLWAVQWHPEFSFRKDPVSVEIVKAFVDASARKD